MATPLEKDIERALGRLVGRHHGRCLKWVCPGWAGVPDRIVLLPGGQIVFVETKRPKGAEVAALQKKWRQWLLDLGFVHRFVFTHEDLKALDLFLSAWDAEVADEGN
jgi:hypothetical protein